MSRRKGAVGEREVARLLTDAGFECYRDGQHDRPFHSDLHHPFEATHCEVKFNNRPRIGEWVRQAIRDQKAQGMRSWAVFWRSNRQPWVVILPLDEYLRLRKEEAGDGRNSDGGQLRL